MSEMDLTASRKGTNKSSILLNLHDGFLVRHSRCVVELFFKEGTCYADLHAFNTGNPNIIKGLIWAAFITAHLKRFLAHAAQQACRVATLTQRIAVAWHPSSQVSF